MKLSFIGCGNMGGALARRLAGAGHEVMVSARHEDKAKAKAEECGKNSKAGSVPEAVAFGDVIFLAVPYGEISSAIKSAGDLKGKVLVDITNALTPDFSGLAIGFTDSAAEQVARLAPVAKVVKAFNTVFAQVVANPKFAEGKPSAFVASDHADAKEKVMRLASDIGFESLDAGPLKNARLLEPLGMMNIFLGYVQGLGADKIAFRVMRR
ncbi:MAG: NADPH-dependent F420 reductase [Candidatus Aenigmarchaeota archaeon]|nr:NADPH-dependent F420 reductase [Candidatus Aenigmarchaeota archaeon]